LPAESIHQPWEEPLLVAKSHYPDRIVRHEVQREKCLAMFQAGSFVLGLEVAVGVA